MMMGAGPVRGTAEMGPKPGGNSVRVNRACGGRGGGGEHRAGRNTERVSRVCGSAHEEPCTGAP